MKSLRKFLGGLWTLALISSMVLAGCNMLDETLTPEAEAEAETPPVPVVGTIRLSVAGGQTLRPGENVRIIAQATGGLDVDWSMLVKTPVGAEEKELTKIIPDTVYANTATLEIAKDQEPLTLIVTGTAKNGSAKDSVEIQVVPKLTNNAIAITDRDGIPVTEIIAGGVQNFIATYQGGNPPVFWGVQGLEKDTDGLWVAGPTLRPDTKLSVNGSLSVSPYEEVEGMRITAALIEDPSVGGWIDIDRIDGSALGLAGEVERFHRNGDFTVDLSGLNIIIGVDPTPAIADIPELTVPSSDTLTIPKDTSLTIMGATSAAHNPKLTIRGKIVVKGKLVIEDTVMAMGNGRIIVEEGGIYEDKNETGPLGFLLNGTTVVKGGGILRTSDEVWNATAGFTEVLDFIGTASEDCVIRLPENSEVTIKVTDPTNAATAKGNFNYTFDKLVLVRKYWELGISDVITVNAGGNLQMIGAGILELGDGTGGVSLPDRDSRLILTAAPGTGGAKITGSGKVVGGNAAAGDPDDGIAITGNAGGWQAVSTTLGQTIDITSDISNTTLTITASIVPGTGDAPPSLNAGQGATITQIDAANVLNIGTAGFPTIVKLGGSPDREMGSIELISGGGSLVLADATSFVTTGNLDRTNGELSTPYLIQALTGSAASGGVYIAKIRDVDNASDALARSRGLVAPATEKYLAEISHDTTGTVAADTNDVVLSSETEVVYEYMP